MPSRRAPAEAVLKDWGRAHRYAGSKDRRAIADKVYQVLRARERLGHLMAADTGRALVIGALHMLDGLRFDRQSTRCIVARAMRRRR